MHAVFVNSGILGHASVAALIREAMATHPEVDATHIDLSAGLTMRERLVRRAMCWGPAAPSSAVGALTLSRWRHEYHAGILAAGRLRAAERSRAIDVLHFHTQATAYASVSRMRRTPAVVSIDITQHLAAAEAPPGPLRWQYAPNVRRDRAVFRAARAVVATSHWAATDLVRDLSECEAKVHVLPYPVPLGNFRREWIDARYERALRGEPTRFLFVGGDFPRKGGPHLLHAWRTANLADHATLRLVTDWPLDPAVLPPRVEVRRGVRAYTSDWFACWRDADIFVMPTTGEAFGMVFQEAAAAGLPSIGTRLNAIPELVSDGKTGVLVGAGDVEGIASAMRCLAGAAELCRTFGTAARARADAALSPRGYGERLADLLGRITAAAIQRPQ